MTCKDRLPDLRRRAKAAGVCAEPAPDAPAPPLDPLLADIFAQVEQIRAWVGEVETNTRRVRRLHADPTYHTNKVLQEQVDALVTASNALGLKVSCALRQLAARCEADAGGAGVAGVAGAGVRGRIARLQAATARAHYAAALHDHQHALQLLRDHQMRLLQDQIKLTNLSITEEECERLLDSNNVAIFVDNVEAQTAEARLALRDAEARRDELERVEAALRHVRDLFLQLAHLVAAQQEQVDSVEYYALQATEHVESGGHQLLKGTVSRRKARKKKIGLIICLTSGFLIVLFVLVYT